MPRELRSQLRGVVVSRVMTDGVGGSDSEPGAKSHRRKEGLSSGVCGFVGDWTSMGGAADYRIIFLSSLTHFSDFLQHLQPNRPNSIPPAHSFSTSQPQCP